MDALISVNGLSRHFGDYCAVNNVDFQLYPGEVLGLLGPNGAGKSTTLRILSGCLAASSGTISILGTDLRSQPLLAKRSIGFLPESPPLYPMLKVDEYLQFCARLRAIPTAQLSNKIDQAKSRTGLQSSGKRLIAHLSKGYQQRVGIAQAIIHEPRIVILDEPTSGLDPNQLVEIRALIASLGQDHGVILSTHILPEVQTLCGRVVIMHEGVLVYSNSLKKAKGEEENQIWIGLSKPPAQHLLETLPGVRKVIAQDGNRFRLALADNHRPESLAEQAVANHWGLFEISPVKQHLEQIFARLTTGDSAT